MDVWLKENLNSAFFAWFVTRTKEATQMEHLFTEHFL